MKSHSDDCKNYMNLQKFEMLNDDQTFLNENVETAEEIAKRIFNKERKAS